MQNNINGTKKIIINKMYNNLLNFNQRNVNNINTSSYVPYADFCFPINYPQNNLQSFNLYPNFINTYNNEIENFKKENEENNTEKKSTKCETDSDLIQFLSGNYLDEKNDETNSEEKSDKKEIDINLGSIIVENSLLKKFPIINLKNRNKYNISIPENILNKGEFFTAIKEEKKDNDMNMNEIDMVDETKNKIVIPDDYLIEINENIIKKLNNFMREKDIKSCIKDKKLQLKDLIEKIYEKCLYNILEIKRNVKNRVKKLKSTELSEQLKIMINFHNEFLSLFLSQNNNNNINIENDEDENNKTYITYAEFYLENNGGKTYKCQICGKSFINHQTLGGHMSKIHPNCSEKYKKKNDIRKQREGQRKLLDSVKEQLFRKYNLNYRLLKEDDEKEKIKSFIKAHQKEYEILKRKIYREKALKDNE